MYKKYGKRLFDLVFSFLALLLAGWLILLLALLVRCKLGSPVFFKQPRPGKIDPKTGKEEIFNMYKLRTMTDEKDSSGALLPDAERLTRFGNFLRSTSLDELPELWCIFIGKMSFVGPRPLAVQYLPYYSEKEHLRHSVLPGLTGLAQVNGRNSTTWEERFAYDLQYVSSVTFANDIRILFRTVAVTLHRSGIGVRGVDSLPDFDTYRKEQLDKEHVTV